MNAKYLGNLHASIGARMEWDAGNCPEVRPRATKINVARNLQDFLRPDYSGSKIDLVCMCSIWDRPVSHMINVEFVRASRWRQGDGRDPGRDPAACSGESVLRAPEK